MFSKKHLKGALASFFISTYSQGVPLDIISFSTTHHFDVEIADTDKKRTTGLMGRRQLSVNKGMLFLFPHKQKQCFWMKNTYVDLDILMINEEGKIVEIIHRMTPHSQKVQCSKIAVRKAIEIQGGICHDRGIQTGDFIVILERV